MHDQSLTAASAQARRGDPEVLAAALVASRADTLASFEAYRRALPDLQVPMSPTVNPPLWELGHVGWFQEYWVARNPQRRLGSRADADAPRSAPLRAQADQLYDSSRIPHDTRWQLPLPSAKATCADLTRQLETTLAALREAPAGDDGLYFFRLALLHEDMHHEAALYMAQLLGVPIADPRWQATELSAPAAPLRLEATPWLLGGPVAEAGFAFDNELPAPWVDVAAVTIDAQAVRWSEYLPFVEAGGYGSDAWWTESGQAWRAANRVAAPRYLRRSGSAWEQWRHGAWRALRVAEAACHLSLHEAQAWCQWAGRRLPTEAEWERVALARPDEFSWGAVWEWTASPFHGHPGFVAHPYRDYSAPWFDGRPVLRGASFMTQPRMRHPCYRNFFPAHRNDLPAGFRSCEIGV